MFSVIVPIYNAEKTLKRCFDSLIEQRYTNFEVLMINDGSDDRSEKICLEYQNKDARFRYHYQENQGVSAARNAGITIARGEFITFLDSDDFYYETYLDEFAKMIIQYPDAGHYWCSIQEYKKDNIKGQVYSVPSDDPIAVYDRKDVMMLHQYVMDASPCNKVYHTELLRKIEMPADISLGEDLIFNYRYLDVNPNTIIVINHAPQYGYYCTASTSLNHKFRADLEAIFDRLITTMDYYLKKWNVGQEQWDIFYQTEFFMHEQVMRNFFHRDCLMSHSGQIKECNRILSKYRMRKCLEKSKHVIHPLYYRAYRTGNYTVVQVLNRIVKIKKKLSEM